MLTREDCSIIVDLPRGSALILDLQFTDCTIETKNMKNARFFGFDYTRCEFKGRFSWVDFGGSPWLGPLTGELDKYDDMVDCDSTEATFDLCRFFSVEISKQVRALAAVRDLLCKRVAGF